MNTSQNDCKLQTKNKPGKYLIILRIKVVQELRQGMNYSLTHFILVCSVLTSLSEFENQYKRLSDLGMEKTAQKNLLELKNDEENLSVEPIALGELETKPGILMQRKIMMI